MPSSICRNETADSHCLENWNLAGEPARLDAVTASRSGETAELRLDRPRHAVLVWWPRPKTGCDRRRSSPKRRARVRVDALDLVRRDGEDIPESNQPRPYRGHGKPRGYGRSCPLSRVGC